MGDLSLHFDTKEFTCSDCGTAQVSTVLVDALEKLRALANSPIIINSGYRCPEHNSRVAGASKSQHILGQAADIRIKGKSLKEAYELALLIPEFEQGGIGLYDNGFLHVDVRGSIARWSRVKGTYTTIDAMLDKLA